MLLTTAYCDEEHFTNDHDTAVASPSAPDKAALICSRYCDDRAEEYENENEHFAPVQFASVPHGTLSLHADTHCNDGSCTLNVALCSAELSSALSPLLVLLPSNTADTVMRAVVCPNDAAGRSITRTDGPGIRRYRGYNSHQKSAV